MKRYKKRIIVLSIFAMFGCSQDPILQTYTLEIPKIQKVSQAKYQNKVLKVSYPQSLLLKMSQEMNFSYSLNDRGTYLNSQWSNHIAKLLQGTWIALLSESQAFKAVLSNSTSIEEDYELESHVFAFEHKVRGKESFAIVSIQFSFIHVKNGKLLKSKRFSYQQRTQTIDAKGYAKATNTILLRLSKDLLRWL